MYATLNFSQKNPTYSKQEGIKYKFLRALVRSMSCEITEEKEPAAVTVLLGEKPFQYPFNKPEICSFMLSSTAALSEGNI